MGKKTTSGVTTNAGLATDGTTITLRYAAGGYVVVLPEKWAGRSATYDPVAKRWKVYA